MTSKVIKFLLCTPSKILAMQALKTCKYFMSDKIVKIDLGHTKVLIDFVDTIVSYSKKRLLSQKILFQYNIKDFKLIIIDDAHRAAAKI